jgi:multidrug resistance protein MdtO
VRLVQFLRRELAPAPGRSRATLRTLVGCLAALVITAVLGGGILPHSHWTVTTVFAVSQSDTGASLRRSLQRLVGTVAGGLLGICVVIAFADMPTVYIPLIGAIAGLGIFLSLTTTTPYVMLLGTMTFILVTFFPPGAVAQVAVETGVWRMIAITIGVACGTGAQLFLWPEDPGDKLRRVLAGRLASVAGAIGRLVERQGPDRVAPPAAIATVGGDDLVAQIDLLTNAEARHPFLRQRHAEQLSLIVEVDRLLTAAAWLSGAPIPVTTANDSGLRREIRAIAQECDALAAALAEGRPPLSSPPAALDEPAGEDVVGFRPTLDDMKLALRRVRGAMGFLDPNRAVVATLDRPTRTPIFTPAFSMQNTAAFQVALRTALGVEICLILLHALDWSAMLTAGVSIVLVAQASLGATIQKSLLRLGGAALGGALGIAAIVIAMPNIESLGALALVSSVGFAIAGWIMAGSARISYMGFQVGLAFSMCVTDTAGPTTDLSTPRDRVIGVLIGVLILLLVDVALWPARARLAMWPALAGALRSIAGLARMAPEARNYGAQLNAAVRLRSGVYRQLAATLRLSGESALEPDAGEAAAERDSMARLIAHGQAVFLALLALIRHRLSSEFPSLPPPVETAMHQLDHSVADTLEALADRVDRRPVPDLPDLHSPLAALEALVPPVAEPVASPRDTAVIAAVAERDHVAIARNLVHEVLLLREAVAAAPASRGGQGLSARARQ